MGTDPCFLAEDVGEMAGAGIADIHADLDDGLRCIQQIGAQRDYGPGTGVAAREIVRPVSYSCGKVYALLFRESVAGTVWEPNPRSAVACRDGCHAAKAALGLIEI